MANFCNYVRTLWELCALKVQERKILKAHIEFGNDLMKMCFKHKTRMKVVYRIKGIRIV